MSESARRPRERLLADVPRDRDAYHAAIVARVRPKMSVLAVGAGRGVLHPFPWSRYEGVRLIGLDPDADAERNPALSEFHLLEGGKPGRVSACRSGLRAFRRRARGPRAARAGPLGWKRIGGRPPTVARWKDEARALPLLTERFTRRDLVPCG